MANNGGWLAVAAAADANWLAVAAAADANWPHLAVGRSFEFYPAGDNGGGALDSYTFVAVDATVPAAVAALRAFTPPDGEVRLANGYAFIAAPHPGAAWVLLYDGRGRNALSTLALFDRVVGCAMACPEGVAPLMAAGAAADGHLVPLPPSPDVPNRDISWPGMIAATAADAQPETAFFFLDPETVPNDVQGFRVHTPRGAIIVSAECLTAARATGVAIPVGPLAYRGARVELEVF
jgi:hypothetical protein